MKILKKDLIIKLAESNKSKDIIYIEKCIYIYMFQYLIKSVAYVDNIKDYINKFVNDCNLFNNVINDLVTNKAVNFDEYFKSSPLILYNDAYTWNKLSKLFDNLQNIVKQSTK